MPHKGKGADPVRGHASAVPLSYADVIAAEDLPSPTGKGTAHIAPTGLRGKGFFTAAAYDTWAPGT